jgi:hypothetical protein
MENRALFAFAEVRVIAQEGADLAAPAPGFFREPGRSAARRAAIRKEPELDKSQRTCRNLPAGGPLRLAAYGHKARSRTLLQVKRVCGWGGYRHDHERRRY